MSSKPKDWCYWGDKLRPAVEAASDIAARLGVSWPKVNENGDRILDEKPVKTNLADGHYMYSVSGEMWWFGRRVTVLGTAASNKPFFSQAGKDKDGNPLYKPVDEIDEPSVMKNAMTNFIVNGLMLITGMKNVTTEELQKAGINVDSIPRVSFKEDFKPQTLTEDGKAQMNWINNFLIRLVGDEVDKKQEWLAEETKWKVKSGKDKGKEIPGKKHLKELKPGQIPFVYRGAKEQVGKLLSTLATELYKDKAEREKKLTDFTTIEVQETGEILTGTSDVSKMSADALCKCYDALLNEQLDKKASEG
jgi:hypothetical protein